MLRHRPRGFTLIELVVTITVFSILVLVAFPAFSSWVANAQLRTAAEGLQSGLHLAQAEALRRNRLVQFTLTNDDPSGAGPWTASTSGRNWVVVTVPIAQMTDPATGAVEVAQLIQGSALGNVASRLAIAGPATISFNSSGAVSGATGMSTYAISRTAASHPLNVTVAPAGQIRACDSTKSIATSPEGC